MYNDIKLNDILTLGKLKELLATKLSKVPNDAIITIVINTTKQNIKYTESISSNIKCISADDSYIAFYNNK